MDGRGNLELQEYFNCRDDVHGQYSFSHKRSSTATPDTISDRLCQLLQWLTWKVTGSGPAQVQGETSCRLWLECFLSADNCLLFASLSIYMLKDVNLYRSHNHGLQKHGGPHSHRERNQLQTDVGFLSARNFLRLSLWKEGKHEKFFSIDELVITDPVLLSRF